MPSQAREESLHGKMLKAEDLHSPHCWWQSTFCGAYMTQREHHMSSEFHEDIQAFPSFLVKDEGGRSIVAVERCLTDFILNTCPTTSSPNLTSKNKIHLTVPLLSVGRIKCRVCLTVLGTVSTDPINWSSQWSYTVDRCCMFVVAKPSATAVSHHCCCVQ